MLPGVACRQLGAHIDEIHAGQWAATVALGEGNKFQFATLGGVVGLGQRCGRGKDQQGVFHDSALFGDVVGIVAGGRFTLVGVFLLLIHDDKS